MIPKEPPLVVRTRAACELLSCKRDRLYRLLRDGEIESFSEGKTRWVEVASIRAYIRRKIEKDRLMRAAPGPNP